MKQAYLPFVAGDLRLRPLAESDLPSTLEWRNRDGVRQQFGTSDALQWDQHIGWFQRFVEKPDDLVFIVEDATTHARIGQVAIYAIDSAARRAEIGRFVASPEFQGRGLMRQGIAALIEFAHKVLGLTSVYLQVRETNERARALYEHLGFVEVSRADGMIEMERSINDHL
ncbi:GNAT family N-acetyltransferase [Paraburkholderia bryophila]|uniref:RimJ/RimL family protein N-acetyltransferase n=1 Tax=Paraburkholderia bryophila TaxID=420952 RepID=A0A7Y9WKJ5_9BURK|nr:GNAT family N-acetyltransferase [Paraburkholderia bryophila]NYH22322.1 RimJ/RimL family protein N-acetyltransferase [Paraburkholderia bryophila]